MDIRDIQNLIKFVSKSEVKEVDLEFENVKIKIVNEDNTIVYAAPQQVAHAPVQHQTIVPAHHVPAVEPVAIPAINSNLVEIKSPMIGTFYSKPSPDKSNFVAIGDEIKAGQVVCVIEAMKLFNEIEAEVSGKIVKILVDDASPVEYGQTLFLVEPN